MKKFIKSIATKLNFAILGLMVTLPVFADDPAKIAEGTAEGSDFCKMLEKLHGLFNWLRIAAFVGAAFYIAAWAWDFISKGEAKMEDVKKKGLALLVGFGLLLMVGFVISFVMSASGQEQIGCKVWKNF